MDTFKIRLKFTHTPAFYENPMSVFINDNIQDSVGTCNVSVEMDEIVGTVTTEEAVDDNMIVYYRYNAVDEIYHALQFRDKQLPGKDGLTIAELRR